MLNRLLRNLVKALPWFTTVREKLVDPAYAGWFLRFNPRNTTTTPYHVPNCAPEDPTKCSPVSDWFQTRCSGFIYKRYGIMLCLLFSSLGAAASTLETGDGSGIALIDSAWRALIEFQRQVLGDSLGEQGEQVEGGKVSPVESEEVGALPGRGDLLGESRQGLAGSEPVGSGRASCSDAPSGARGFERGWPPIAERPRPRRPSGSSR